MIRLMLAVWSHCCLFPASLGAQAPMTLTPNVWMLVTPTYTGAPDGGSINPMTYNVIGVYDPGSQRTISFERWEDPVRRGSIYANAALAYDPLTNVVTVVKLNNWTVVQRPSGGYTTEPLPLNATDPTPVDRHPLGGLGLDPIGNAVYLVNGANQTAPSGHPQDTWRLNLATRRWARVAAIGPHPPIDVGGFSGMVYDPPSRKLAYFVASFPNGTYTWLLDTATNTWAEAPKDPSAADVYTASAGFAYDIRRNRVLVLGGGFNIVSPPSPKLRAYSVTDNKWTNLADAPLPAHGSEFAYDSKNDVVLALVGKTTLIYNPVTNTWVQLPGDFQRGTNLVRQNVTYNVAQDVFVYQGGTWDQPVWGLFRYSNGSPPPPPPPSSAPMNLRITR